jgi:BirA family biotin operon repressor/biotin-[acetyl-CoA-carboxylase] ligase
VSERDAGLYLSVVLRPSLEARYFPLITLMAGVAVHDALREFGIDPDIKWVNDILVQDKKIAGILAETTETPGGTAVVLGIGINLTSSNFPPDLVATTTCLEDISNTACTRDELIEVLAKRLSHFYDLLQVENGPVNILDNWRDRSSYFAGKVVRVALENETITGTTDGLESNGALRIRKSDGKVAIVQAGDVERVRAVP